VDCDQKTSATIYTKKSKDFKILSKTFFFKYSMEGIVNASATYAALLQIIKKRYLNVTHQGVVKGQFTILYRRPCLLKNSIRPPFCIGPQRWFSCSCYLWDTNSKPVVENSAELPRLLYIRRTGKYLKILNGRNHVFSSIFIKKFVFKKIILIC
jgi:hypothetical protein